MRTTINLDEDALLAARHVAPHERLSLGEAVSERVRRGATAGGAAAPGERSRLRGRFALLPARDEAITPQHVPELMHREGMCAPRRHAAMRSLLDVKVWVALFDDAHPFSERAIAFIAARGSKIATCPLVENGGIRVLSLPSYGRHGGLPIRVVRERLREACAALRWITSSGPTI